MKESGIVVDFEWAYKQAMSHGNVKGQSPSWIKSFVDGWREGYLKGYLMGWTMGTIEVVGRMKGYGVPPVTIADVTGLSLGAIDLIKADKTTKL